MYGVLSAGNGVYPITLTTLPAGAKISGIAGYTGHPRAALTPRLLYTFPSVYAYNN
ncbi:hypothetical protein HGH93_15375 [Chitinophaga polysaccharea]|uniref:hypothetical protein n=1 Tax=Chitinophaga polysaccharea TaxID=1293035 RepID=UPI001454E70E|nr:hypothetical protein [Chitinophaga polysaccharea]NLR59495.1 hypothetical protein [Chitinophaga polysaccharea]